MNKSDLVNENIKLVYYTINKYHSKYIRDEDMIQVGMVGLCKAADKYDERKVKFSTFACVCIRNAIRDELKKRQKYGKPLSYEALISGEYGNFKEG